MPSFLSAIADKAQSAISSSPLASHLPSNLTGHGRPSSPGLDLSGQPQAGAHGGIRSHAFDTIQHQLRTIGQQYATTSPLQKLVTTEKGVAIDYESISGDSKAQSKELYNWGQSEAKDLQDVTDRLAYLNFVHGALAGALATKLDAARAPLKALRELENTLTPRRNIRAGLRLQISRLEQEKRPGTELRIAELRQQLKKAESEDESPEKQADILKRKAIRESEQGKWDALREYGEKLVLAAQAANPILSVLPTLPPTESQPYSGSQETAATRAALQRALDNYKTGQISLPLHLSASELSRSDTASFGESHASELSSIGPDHLNVPSNIQASPPQPIAPLPPTERHDAAPPGQPGQQKTIDPLTLNQTPTALPPVVAAATPPVPITAEGSTEPAPPIPTIADTGVPVSAGADGPGPASGSLLELRARRETGQSSSISPSIAAAAGVAGATSAPESTEDKKRRLAREEAERVAAQASSATSATAPITSTSTYESAEEEKRRREREERERVLAQGEQQQIGQIQTGEQEESPKDEEQLPPYEPI